MAYSSCCSFFAVSVVAVADAVAVVAAAVASAAVAAAAAVCYSNDYCCSR